MNISQCNADLKTSPGMQIGLSVRQKPSSTLGLAVATFLAAMAGSEAHESSEAFEAQLRDLLMNNPDIILDAMSALAEREKVSAQTAAISAYPYLFEEPASLGIGNPAAPLRVVEFFDYRCEPCKAMHPGLKKLVSDNPELRIEMRQLPILSPASERAARFALAVRNVAGAEAYNRVHDALWIHRGPYNSGVFSQLAEAEGLDWAVVDAAMESTEVETRISGNRDIAIALEILGTPAFVSPNSIQFGQGDIQEMAAKWLSQ